PPDVARQPHWYASVPPPLTVTFAVEPVPLMQTFGVSTVATTLASGAQPVGVISTVEKRTPAGPSARRRRTKRSETSGVNVGLRIFVADSSATEPAGRRKIFHSQVVAVLGDVSSCTTVLTAGVVEDAVAMSLMPGARARRMLLASPSMMYRLPAPLLVTLKGFENRAKLPVPSTTTARPGDPASVVTSADNVTLRRRRF